MQQVMLKKQKSDQNKGKKVKGGRKVPLENDISFS